MKIGLVDKLDFEAKAKPVECKPVYAHIFDIKIEDNELIVSVTYITRGDILFTFTTNKSFQVDDAKKITSIYFFQGEIFVTLKDRSLKKIPLELEEKIFNDIKNEFKNKVLICSEVNYDSD